MFGYVVADPAQLDEDQRRRYRAAYCGLCRALGDRCSQASRLSLTYDMTFLVVLLTSLYEPEETAGESRCPVHPLRPQPWWRSPFTDYGAAMNVLLAHENCLDDWRDDRSLPKLALARLFRGPGRAPSAFTDELTMLLGECTAAFERLPLVQDAALLRSVLYAGVWARLRAAEAKKTANETGGDPHGSGSL